MKLRISPKPALSLVLSCIALVDTACTDDTGTASIPGAVGGVTGADRGGSSASSTGTTTSSASGGSSNSTHAAGGTQSSSNSASNPSSGTNPSNGGTSNSASNSATGGTSTSSATATGGRVATGGTSSANGGTSTATGGRTTGSTTSAPTGGRASTGGTAAGVGGSARGGSSAVGGSSAAVGGQSSGGSSNSATGGTPTSSTAAKFSFFVTSYAAIKAISGSDQGFGGDLRHGETGDGAGLRGADKLCTEIAERSMKGNGKTWKAYLSTSTVNAIDRVGPGPWYDRRGRTVALTKEALLFTRPQGADAAIINDLPNEDGVPNHSPDGTQVDNHDTLTGSDHNGKLFSANAHCSDWTSSAKDNTKPPRVGHTWPRGSTGSGNTPGMAHWASALDEAGCGAGVNLQETGGPIKSDPTVGSGGGYGGFYCFALTP